MNDPMAVYGIIIAILWTIFILYWIISAVSVKKDVYRQGAWWQRAFVFAIAAFVLTNLVPAWREPLFPQSPAFAIAAIVLTAIGILFAVWARIHLGANWSSQPALKEGHELVTSGPYRFVRHPIYTGVILAFIGTALVNNMLWDVVILLVAIMFVRRVYAEDRLMARQFPDRYPEYKKRTKALIPFVW